MKKIKLVHNQFYPEYMKLLKRFTEKPSGYREVLKYVHHKEDGSIEATDTLKFVRINQAHGYEKELLISPRNMQAIEGLTFPATDKLIPELENAVATVEVSANQLEIWRQCAVGAGNLKRNIFKGLEKSITLECNEGSIEARFDGDQESQMVTKLPFLKADGELPTIAFEPELLRDCLEIIGVEKTNATMYFFGTMRQFVLKNDCVTVVCMPMRRY